MPRFLFFLTRIFCVLFLLSAPAVAAESIGVVLMHGKNGSPDRFIASLSGALTRSGAMVETPEMPWSKRRGFDKSYDAALDEIDVAVSRLRERGATRIVIAGHSLGANAALGYAARRSGLFALMLLAPGHTPELTRQRYAESLGKAKAMLEEGRGGETAQFLELNQGQELQVSTWPGLYLSYNDPDGMAVMPRNATAVKTPLPVLWVVGSNDKMSERGQSYCFDKFPAHPDSRYLLVEADHFRTPDIAADQIIAWLTEINR